MGLLKHNSAEGGLVPELEHVAAVLEDPENILDPDLGAVLEVEGVVKLHGARHVQVQLLRATYIDPDHAVGAPRVLGRLGGVSNRADKGHLLADSGAWII